MVHVALGMPAYAWQARTDHNADMQSVQTMNEQLPIADTSLNKYSQAALATTQCKPTKMQATRETSCDVIYTVRSCTSLKFNPGAPCHCHAG
jgi:hypothetical protein